MITHFLFYFIQLLKLTHFNISATTFRNCILGFSSSAHQMVWQADCPIWQAEKELSS